jgi:hypothetical protein
MSDIPIGAIKPALSDQLPALSSSPAGNAGQFRSGQSGNPAGRPRGARSNATMAALALLGEAGERLMREGIDRALDGDSLLLRCCIMRLAPVPRGRPVELDLAEGSAAGDVLASLTATVRAMAEGTISPLEAADVAEVLEGQRRAVETGDLERRLTRLEDAAAYIVQRQLAADDDDEASDAVGDAPERSACDAPPEGTAQPDTAP